MLKKPPGGCVGAQRTPPRSGPGAGCPTPPHDGIYMLRDLLIIILFLHGLLCLQLILFVVECF